MDPELRRAWTEVVTADDYERHMAAIGQAQAAAELTAWALRSAGLAAGDSVTVAGAGTGQMLDFFDPAALRPYRLTFADLNRRIPGPARRATEAARHTWRARGRRFRADKLAGRAGAAGGDAAARAHRVAARVESMARLQPRRCAIVMQENPPGMATAVTPGRVVPESIAKAMATAHAKLVVRDELVGEMERLGYGLRAEESREVADGKRLVGLLFGADGGRVERPGRPARSARKRDLARPYAVMLRRLNGITVSLRTPSAQRWSIESCRTGPAWKARDCVRNSYLSMVQADLPAKLRTMRPKTLRRIGQDSFEQDRPADGQLNEGAHG